MAEQIDDLILESLDAVPEPLRGLFQQEDGGFKFVKPEDPAPLKRKNAEILGEKKREQQQRQQLEQQLNDLRAKLKVDDEDIDLDAVAELWRKSKAAPNGDGKQVDAAVQAEAARERKKAVDDAVKKLEETKLTPLQTENAQLREMVSKTVIEGGVRSYCDNPKLPFKFEDGAVDTLIDILRAQQPFEFKDGKCVVRDGLTDDDGNPVESMEAWVAYQAAKRPFLLQRSSGSGAVNGQNGNGAGLSSLKWESMSEAQRAELSLKDPAAHKKAFMAYLARQGSQKTQQARVAAA